MDLRAEPAFTQHQPPQGYFHVAADERRLFDAVLRLRELVGEFDKPRFVTFDATLCAHSRNRRTGCTRCLDLCPTGAITPGKDSVVISATGGATLGRAGALGVDRDAFTERFSVRVGLCATAARSLPCHCITTSDCGSWMGSVRTRIASMKL